MIKEAFLTSLLLVVAIVLGSVSGLTLPQSAVLADYVDYLILALVFLLFVDVSFDKLLATLKQPRMLIIAWLTNFLILPFLGFGLTQVFLPNQPLVAIGLAVYFMSPCTDWFLGFTRMAKGNTGLGSVLLPINMLTQLLLYPFFLQWFSQNTVASISASEIADTLLNWFAVPAIAALMINVIGYKIKGLTENLSALTNWVIYALVFCIFAVNVQQIVDHYPIFGIVLLTVITFFIISLLLTETVAKKLQVSDEDHVLYTMTTTARNAPLMLGITMTALPDQPMIYASLIIGMLIEFPYLALQVMRFNAMRARKSTVNSHPNTFEHLRKAWLITR